MVIEIQRVASNVPKPVVAVIDAVTSEATGGGGSYEVKCTVIENNGDNATTVANGARLQVIGTAFGEATQSPSFFTEELSSDYGLTQIFKTACEWSGSTLATRYRGSNTLLILSVQCFLDKKASRTVSVILTVLFQVLSERRLQVLCFRQAQQLGVTFPELLMVEQ